MINQQLEVSNLISTFVCINSNIIHDTTKVSLKDTLKQNLVLVLVVFIDVLDDEITLRSSS